MIYLPDLLKDYNLHNVHNADESSLFFKCMPDQILAFWIEECGEGGNSKEHVTIFFAANATGNSKLPLVLVNLQSHTVLF